MRQKTEYIRCPVISNWLFILKNCIMNTKFNLSLAVLLMIPLKMLMHSHSTFSIASIFLMSLTCLQD